MLTKSNTPSQKQGESFVHNKELPILIRQAKRAQSRFPSIQLKSLEVNG